MEWALFDGQIYFRVEQGRLPDLYNPSDASLTVGLTLYKVENVAIGNLFVQGYQLDGINLQDVRYPCTLTQISARGNGRSGIAVCGASRASIEACLAGNNGASQLHLEGPSETHVENCDLIPEHGPEMDQGGHEPIVRGREAGRVIVAETLVPRPSLGTRQS